MDPNFEPDPQLTLALLVLTEDGEFRRSWAVDRETMTIGRLSENDVCINDRWVSRRHAQIRRQGEQTILEDLGSKNGLSVNGRRLTLPLALEDGDSIQITPHIQLTFVDNEATAPLFCQQAGIVIDRSACRVWVRGIELIPPLSKHQFDLLHTLFASPGRVFSRDELIAAVWPDEDPGGISDEALNSLIRRLRGRLGEVDPDSDELCPYIHTVRGHGFRFEMP